MALINWTPPITEQLCACGCAGSIVPQPHHRYHPPKYLTGHARVAVTRKFMEENVNKHICACGCNEYIEIKPKHSGKSRGIPKYKPLHWPKVIHKVHAKKVETYLETHTKRKRTWEFEFTFWQRVDLLRKFNYACGKCAWSVDYHKLQFDHIIPISMGGRADIENGQVLCENCHATKTYEETKLFQYNLWRY